VYVCIRVCMYVYMYVCIYVCRTALVGRSRGHLCYACMYVYTSFVCIHIHIRVCIYVVQHWWDSHVDEDATYVLCMYTCMYVCMCVDLHWVCAECVCMHVCMFIMHI
jgi:hypothetical protein